MSTAQRIGVFTYRYHCKGSGCPERGVNYLVVRRPDAVGKMPRCNICLAFMELTSEQPLLTVFMTGMRVPYSIIAQRWTKEEAFSVN